MVSVLSYLSSRNNGPFRIFYTHLEKYIWLMPDFPSPSTVDDLPWPGSGWYCPCIHGSCSAGSLQEWPAEQSTCSVRPTPAQFLPLSHRVQLIAPFLEYVPAHIGLRKDLSQWYDISYIIPYISSVNLTKHFVGSAGFEHSQPAVQFVGELVP